MKYLAQLLLIPIILTISLSTTFANTFTDVEVGDAHYVAISYLQEQGIIHGYNDNSFQAYKDINRAEALKMLILANNVFSEQDIEQIEEEEKRPFTDTPLSEWYTSYLITAKEKGIIHGYPDGSFKPDQIINLAEALKIHLESFENLEYPDIDDYLFDDTPKDSWFTKYTAFAASDNLINIYNSNTVNPNQEMTRGYLAEIIYRMIMSQQGYEFGKATFYGAAVQGWGTASGETFDMYKHTAAHKTLPFGTIVKVTNLANGESVEVKINDRGPYGPGRVIDLSSSAFDEIAWLGTGIINVQYKIIHIP